MFLGKHRSQITHCRKLGRRQTWRSSHFFTCSRLVWGIKCEGAVPEWCCWSAGSPCWHVTRAEPPASPAPARPSPSVVPNPGQVRVQLCGEGPQIFLKILHQWSWGLGGRERQTVSTLSSEAEAHIGGSCLSHFIHTATSLLHSCQPCGFQAQLQM